MCRPWNALARLCGIALAASLVACAGFEELALEQIAAKPGARILAIGDSVMWWNADEGRSIADAIATDLAEPVVNLAVPGAAISHRDAALAAEGLDIRAQYRSRNWSWVVVNGGANDLGDEGPSRGCAKVVDELAAADGRSGEIPELIKSVRSSGSRVVVLGYYRLPELGPTEQFCGNALETLGERIKAMAAQDPDVYYVTMADVVDSADPQAFDRDRIHPSARSSIAIGKLVAATIRKAEQR